jgi:ABC-type transport system involved in multi-copper enzyme maturation permease subunit
VVRALTAIWAIAAKDMRLAVLERVSMFQAVVFPINYLVMMSLFVLSGSNAPTAVVMLDHGVYAQQFVAAMKQAHSFRIVVESRQQADAQMQAGTLVTEVTIPPGFGQAIEHHQPMTVPVMVNNINEDLTNDAQRGMRLSLATFYAAMSPGQVPVTVVVHNQYDAGTGYIPFLSLTILVIALMSTGMLQAGNASAREYEESTMAGLLLAPVRSWQLLAGRFLGAFLISVAAVGVGLAVVVLLVGAPQHFALTCGIAVLTLAVFCAAGVALGTLTRDRSLVSMLVRAIPIPLFFLSGVFGPLSYQPGAVQAIGQVVPVHWAIVLTQYGFKNFLTGTLPVSAESGILAAYLVAFAAFAAVALRLTSRARAKAALSGGRALRLADADRVHDAGPPPAMTRPATIQPATVTQALPAGTAGKRRFVPAPAWLTAMLAICAKDLRVARSAPGLAIGTLLLPTSFALVAFMGSAATSANPVVVVNLDHGRYGAQLVRAIEDAQVFRLTETGSPAAARQLYNGQQDAAIVTIPADTTALLNSHRQVHVQVTVANINNDVAYDIYRAVPDAMISWYQSRPRPGPLQVTLADQTMRPQNILLYQYSLLPIIALVVTVSGILVSGMAAAEEFERGTVTGLLLAPVPRAAIVAGKIIAGWVFTFTLAVLVLAAGAVLGWTRPYGVAGWVEALAALALGSLFAAGFGIALGTWSQRKQPVSVYAILISLQLFALAGGLGCIFFEPVWLQDIARWDPLTYMIHSLQQAVFYHSTAGAARDAAVVAGAALLAGAAGTLAMRRGLKAG